MTVCQKHRFDNPEVYHVMDLLMGLFRGAVFQHEGLPEKCRLALMGQFRSLMGRFETFLS